MGDSEKPADLVKSPLLHLILQARQFPIPLWARLMILVAANSVFLVGAALVWQGSMASCSPHCEPRLLDAGIKVISFALLPVLVSFYLVFSETGGRALSRKTRELLEKTIPTALTMQYDNEAATGENDIRASKIELLGPATGPMVFYRVTLSRKDGKATLLFKVDLNVRKINVVFHFPAACVSAGPVPHRKLKTSLSGAAHEGYDIDQETIVNGEHVLLCARRRLADDFLWDPAAKLYFAQDLRFFVHSVVEEAWDWLNQND